MRRLPILFACALVAGCATDVDEREPIATTEQAITNSVNDDQDPGVVALLVDGRVVCSGVLVTSHIVVTAAHCLDESPPDTVFFGSDPRTGKGRFIAISSHEQHPDYDPDTLASDIAVVGLAETAPAAPLPVLTKAFDASFVKMPLRVAGFGATKGGGDAALRKHAGASVLTTYSKDDFRFTAGPSQTCEGDSGGPAFATIGGREYVIGITSYGDTDCKSYGNDVRMDVHVPWVTGYAKAYRAPAGPITNGGCSVVTPDTGSTPPRATPWLLAALVLVALARRRSSISV